MRDLGRTFRVIRERAGVLDLSRRADAGIVKAARLVVPAGQRERLERVCRYALRPPVAGDRLRVTGDGQVQLQLRHRWTDGTTHLEFDPLEFLGRLAVLVPRPRINLILYHGVLRPRSEWRSEMVRRDAPHVGGDAGSSGIPV